jgi:hypothetical protein
MMAIVQLILTVVLINIYNVRMDYVNVFQLIHCGRMDIKHA